MGARALAAAILLIATVGTGTYGNSEVNRTAIARLLSGSLGDAAGAVAAAIALLISLGTANAFVAATSRLGYALSRDGVFPRPIQRVNPNGAPMIAVSVVGCWALLCLLAVLALSYRHRYAPNPQRSNARHETNNPRCRHRLTALESPRRRGPFSCRPVAPGRSTASRRARRVSVFDRSVA